MAVTVIFETHSTTFDNENGIASGWNDVRLSPAGLDQAKELGERYRNEFKPDVIFCSDLQRSVRTAMIAFDSLTPAQIFTDWRLRECNYGELNGTEKSAIESARANHITVSYESGEDYQRCADRVASFLADLKAHFDGKVVLVIGHRATQYGLEHWLNNKTLEEVVAGPWQWQPGWRYEMH